MATFGCNRAGTLTPRSAGSRRDVSDPARLDKAQHTAGPVWGRLGECMSRTDLLPDAGPVLSLRQALYRAGRDFRGGITSLAQSMVMDLDTLQKKLKLDEERRWLNPDELEDVIGITQDDRLLDALVRPAGAVWYRPVPVPATQDALKAVGELLQKEGAFVGSLHDGAADKVWQPHEVALLEHHGNEVIRAVLSIMAGARSAMEGRSNG